MNLLLKVLRAKCRRQKTAILAASAVAIALLTVFGAFTHLFEQNYYSNFRYPYEGDVYKLVQQLRHNLTPDIPPINRYNYTFLLNCGTKCSSTERLRFVYLIKTKPGSFKQRTVIRSTWGYERRFSDVEIRTVFLLGVRQDAKLQQAIQYEASKHQDIVQADFQDSYFNNTIKTMIGFKWAARYCANAQFYMLVDEDYYVSTKNVLRFVRNPTNYPAYLAKPFDDIKNVLFKPRRGLQTFDFELPEDVKLYAGYVFDSSPHRHFTSKWYVSLKEYPYHKWPPYVTAGAVVLSKESLLDMYYASYYTKHFRFDDVYLALLALKVHIEPFHCDEFYFYKSGQYAYTVASHGFDEPEELLEVWTQQKSVGNA